MGAWPKACSTERWTCCWAGRAWGAPGPVGSSARTAAPSCRAERRRPGRPPCRPGWSSRGRRRSTRGRCGRWCWGSRSGGCSGWRSRWRGCWRRRCRASCRGGVRWCWRRCPPGRGWCGRAATTPPWRSPCERRGGSVGRVSTSRCTGCCGCGPAWPTSPISTRPSEPRTWPGRCEPPGERCSGCCGGTPTSGWWSATTSSRQVRPPARRNARWSQGASRWSGSRPWRPPRAASPAP
jgi:hypothetical protein